MSSSACLSSNLMGYYQHHVAETDEEEDLVGLFLLDDFSADDSTANNHLFSPEATFTATPYNHNNNIVNVDANPFLHPVPSPFHAPPPLPLCIQPQDHYHLAKRLKCLPFPTSLTSPSLSAQEECVYNMIPPLHSLFNYRTDAASGGRTGESGASHEEEVVSGVMMDHALGNGGSRSAAAETVTAQSRAARERRRKIAEKTQELAKLVPGGLKMNTADMLLAAFNYLKFLQAQFHILHCSIDAACSFPQETQKNRKEEGDAGEDGLQLAALLKSGAVQEKLYAEQKCLVLKRTVNLLAKYSHYFFPSDPSISYHLNRLIIPSDG